MSELNDIWSNNKGNLPEEQLRAYLEGKLNAEQQREVEKWLAEEGMENDAIEGLKEISAGQAQKSVNRINQNLNKRLNIKDKRKISFNDLSTYIAIILMLLIAVVAYYVLRIILK
jgi:succinate dehydrogenase/fumarate reductase flavoprotein subunit